MILEELLSPCQTPFRLRPKAQTVSVLRRLFATPRNCIERHAVEVYGKA
jgi:hypothetical protein